MGLDIGDVVAEGLDLSLPETGMFLWGMEAFTDSRIIETTLRTIDAYGLQENGFFEDLNAPYIRAIRGLGLLKPVARMLNPVTNGVALQRADTYTYKTADYCLSTTQRYQPGFYADQQHVWRAVLSPQIAVFTTHPARPFSDSKYLNESPGYWVGSGRLPLAAQDENVVLVMYRLPRSPGFMENGVMPFTHAYFPVRSFSEVVREPTRIYGRTGNTYIALIAGSELSLTRLSEDDFVQSGRQTWWICELGSRSEDGSFEAFAERVRAQPAVFERGVLSYVTPRGKYRLSWPEGLSLDGSPVRDRYERIESPWCSLQRGDRVLEASCNGMMLSIDFAKGSRVSR
jgi:hypothetical protein